MEKNNIKYQDSLELITNSHYILILTHKNPDADTISCALSLSNYMYENKIKHKVFNNTTTLPRSLDFLSKFDKITNIVPKYYDLVIYVDCGDKKRVDIEIDKDVKVINIDHHQSNTMFGDINIVDDSKGSCAEVMYSFFDINNLKISKNTAECLYVGIYDDNIAFTTSRTTQGTFEIINKLIQVGISPNKIANNLLSRDSLAKYRILPKILNTLELSNEGKVATIYLDSGWLKQTGATTQECDEVINMILNIAIVEIACYLRVIDKKVRVSLRSKNDIDISNIAKMFNGGGHKNAAGMTVETDSITDAKKQLLICINENIKNYI
ncbi:MAG: bifunctional oligoribonuclease/PAP phosphatase NrnA [Campylobacterota bacterium]|nr:bifunctional oligoribonuclease/PAP phosphatase NrnA [Campylobacterota bacterium]